MDDEINRWVDIAITAFDRCPERPTLGLVHYWVARILPFTPFATTNDNPKATIRRTLQDYCSTCPAYERGARRPSLFVHRGHGRWMLDKPAVDKWRAERREAMEYLAQLGL